MQTPSFEPVHLGRRHVALAIPLLAFGLAAPSVRAAEGTHRTSRVLMGTRVDMTLQGGSNADLAQAAEAAYSEMTRLANMMSRYQSTSPLNAINLMAGLQPVKVPTELMQVLLMAKRTHQATHGNFDATVGSLRGWNFDANNPAIPDAEKIAHQLYLIGQSKGLVLDERASTAFLTIRGMALDLGGIAKLPILNAGMQQLKVRGVDNVMINGGGDVLVNGTMNSRPWRVGIRDPREPLKVIGEVAMTQGFIAASGDYERYFMHQGRRFHHVLDPKTGYPSQGTRGVALVSDRLEDINGLGTAIMVGGKVAAKDALARTHGVHALVANSDNSLWLSAGMQHRLA